MKISRSALFTACLTSLVAVGVSGGHVYANEREGPTIAMDGAGPGNLVRPTGLGSQSTLAENDTLTTKNANNCAGDLTICGAGIVGFALSCAAETWATLGALTGPCIVAFSGLGSACASAATTCTGGQADPDDPVRRLAAVGVMSSVNNDNYESAVCPGRSFVDGVRVFYDASSARVTRLRLRCTPTTNGGQNTFLDLGVDSPANSTSGNFACSAGRLMGGLLFRAGAELDAAGAACKKVASYDETLSNTSMYGGSGGIRQDRLCPADTHMVGAAVRVDRAGEINPNITGVEVWCDDD
jgi:hypothetical protein